MNTIIKDIIKDLLVITNDLKEDEDIRRIKKELCVNYAILMEEL